MASPAGFAGQFGIKTEVTPGTAVTVDQFIPVNKAPFKQDIPRFNSAAIQAGRFTTAQWGTGIATVTGSVDLDLTNKKLATLLKHCFGSVVTTGSGPYTHTFTPGSLLGVSFTAQVGLPDLSGTVNAKTLAGCKINSWEIAGQADSFVNMTLDILGMSETTATALASASYASGRQPFRFQDATLTVAGSGSSAVKSYSIKGDNALEARKRASGNKEPLPNGTRTYSGQLVTDFESLTAYNRFVDGTETALVIAFSNGTDTLTFTCNVRYDGETPTLEGPGMLEQSLPFVCVSGTSDAAAITAVLVNTDTSAA